MNSRIAFVATTCLAALAALATAVPGTAGEADTAISAEEAKGIIFERQNLMLQLDDDAELLGEIAAGIKTADRLEEVTRSIAEAAAASKAAFEPHLPGGRSKPEIWSNWADYSQRLDAFERDTKQMAELGAKGDLVGVTGMLGTALPCKECHTVYRAPKK